MQLDEEFARAKVGPISHFLEQLMFIAYCSGNMVIKVLEMVVIRYSPEQQS